MTIIFTDTENEWIDKKPFEWKIKEGCPDNIIKALKRKLDLLYKTSYMTGGDLHGRDINPHGRS